ncbi:MAG: VacB/RNase II family 3'-5' exoribonuclease [Clostridia bacterium]|nr:VacB/RNase II family 3'-5' exoribonuclease [Clostridia bacterium]
MKKRSADKRMLKKVGKKNKTKAAAKKRSAVYSGVFSSSRSGYGFVIPDEKYNDRFKDDVFIPAKYVYDAVNGDKVAFVMTGHGDEARIAHVISRSVITFTGTYRAVTRFEGGKRKNKHIVTADDTRLCFDTYLSEKNVSGAKSGDKVLCEILAYPNVTEEKPAWGKIVEVYGDSEDLVSNEKSLLASHHVRVGFSPQILDEAEKVSHNPVVKRGRKDLTGMTVFTIDSEYAKDLDDAISFDTEGEYSILGVHIADVSSYVTEGSLCDKEAFLRGTSIYYADKVIPMLPAALSNGACSLNANVNRRAVSVFMKIDREGVIVSKEICESVIRSKVRGVYSEINDVIDKKENSVYYEKYACVLGDGRLDVMIGLYNALYEKSKRRGALELETPEPVFLIEDGVTKDVIQAERGLSERIIEQFMIAANEAVAAALRESDLPCIYRTHDAPDEEKIKKLKIFAHNAGLDTTALNGKKVKPSDLSALLSKAKEKDCEEAFSYLILRSMMKAKYESAPSPHYGIGAENYCHFTSPIRRYPDLFVHRSLKSLLIKNGSNKRKNELVISANVSAKRSNECEQASLELERDMEDLYRADYMRAHIDEEFTGTVSSVLPGGVFVRLENTCEGFITFERRFNYKYDEERQTIVFAGKAYTVGMKIRIRVVSCDICKRRVDFEEVRR